MKPQARIQAVIDILEKTAGSRVPMDTVVGDYMRVRRYIGAKDRAYIAERAYTVIRSFARIGWWVARSGQPDSPRAFIIALLVLEEKASLKRVDDLFDGSKFSPEPLSDEERSFIMGMEGHGLEHPDMPADVKVECPPLYARSIKEYFGKDFSSEMRAMIAGATLDLRVNTALATREKAQEYLQAGGVESTPTPYCPWGLRVKGKAYLAHTKAFSKGWVEIQDEGSQLIAWICGAKPGMQVLDYCAGAGGKTLALAGAMERKGRIVAMDNDDRRLQKGRERFRKGHVSDIIEVRPLTDDKNRKWLRRQKGTFDITLCDVPCTGTGTWRRNPDMRWAVYGPPLEELMAIQADILDRVAHTVKPGGTLVYATCSLLPEENERQVEAFLTRHPDFAVKPVEPTFGIGSPYMRLTPLRHNTDAFFAAVLEKKSAAE